MKASELTPEERWMFAPMWLKVLILTFIGLAPFCEWIVNVMCCYLFGWSCM